ncbi:MAG: ArdC family protein [Solirubrobacterales bacterium]
MSATRSRSGALTEEERTARRAQERRQMAEAVDALRTSEGWQRWLKVRRHFHSYSFHNQLLIAQQCPDATRVAGFRAWLKLGYAVRRGERGIRIWAPCPPSKKQIAEWRQAGANPHERPPTYFRLVAVFDRSQVNPFPDFPGGPIELEPPSEPIGGEGLAHLFGPLVEFGCSLGLTVEVEPVPGAAQGYLEPATDRLVIDVKGESFSANAQVQTLIHELAHALVRHDRQPADPKLPYAEEEVVVESVAYAVCASLGLDTSPSSIPYIAGWGERSDDEPIECYAALIDRLAHRLEVALKPSHAPDISTSPGIARPSGRSSPAVPSFPAPPAPQSPNP